MPLIIPMTDISLLYLNQIAGPSLEHWNLKPSIHHESGTPYLQSRLQPDVWWNQYINGALGCLPLLKISPMKYILDLWTVRWKGKEKAQLN